MSSPSPSPTPQLREFELNLLKEEYFFLQKTIEDYNQQIWLIKALGLTGTGAAIAFTIQLKLGIVAIIGCVIPLFFWILESQWKHFQRGFYPRVVEIEDIFKNESKLRSPTIYTSWTTAFKRRSPSKSKSYFRDGLLNPSVFVSYALAIAFLLILAFLTPYVLK